ncbi:hypothetical protein V8E55_004246 [Tylopilus felleus]
MRRKALAMPSGHLRHALATQTAHLQIPSPTNKIIFLPMRPVVKERKYCCHHSRLQMTLGTHVGETSYGQRSPIIIASISRRVIFAGCLRLEHRVAASPGSNWVSFAMNETEHHCTTHYAIIASGRNMVNCCMTVRRSSAPCCEHHLITMLWSQVVVKRELTSSPNAIDISMVIKIILPRESGQRLHSSGRLKMKCCLLERDKPRHRLPM